MRGLKHTLSGISKQIYSQNKAQAFFHAKTQRFLGVGGGDVQIYNQNEAQAHFT